MPAHTATIQPTAVTVPAPDRSVPAAPPVARSAWIGWVLQLTTALAPIAWGTTYAVTTELLPPGRPLLAGLLRALPVGLALALVLIHVINRRSFGWSMNVHVDPVILAQAVALALAAALLAGLYPAYRMVMTSPAEALRVE